MNKLELIDVVAKELNLTNREAKTVVEVIFGTIKDNMKNGEPVNIGGFGVFKVKKRKARKGINPKTGDRIDIAEAKAPAFRPSKTLKDYLN